MPKSARHIGYVLLGVSLFWGCAAGLTAKKPQVEATRSLGEAYLAQRNYAMALRELLNAEKMNPDDYLTQYDLGLVYYARKKADLAIRHFEESLRLRPEYAPARNSIGAAYLSIENWDAAIAALKPLQGDLLYATPHYPLTNLGYAYYRKGDYQTAETYLLKALDYEPNFPIALRHLGRVMLATGRVAEAVQRLQRAAELDPRSAEIQMTLGDAYNASFQPDRAIQAYRKVLDLAPSSDLAAVAEKEIAKLQ